MKSEVRDPGSEKKVIRDKSPAIPATDGAIDITGLQSQLFVGTNDTHRFYGGPQKRRYSERCHRCYKRPDSVRFEFSKDSCDPEV